MTHTLSSEPSSYNKVSLAVSQAVTLCVFAALWIAMYFNTFADIVSIWFSSTTFEHAVLIVPVTCWLIYRKRYAFNLASSRNTLSSIGFLGLVGCTILYLIGKLALIGAVEHFAVMAMPLFFVWAVLGTAVVKLLLFPLLFLLLAVPFGEFLIPDLQEVTADLTVFMLNAVSVPVYREGWYLQIPEGLFHVAEACSGIRFLFSTITIGLLITHLDIASRIKQVVFMICVCLIPILANGIRAFIMVYIGHISNMEAAVGFDHLVYGWVFFFIVTVLVLLFSRLFYDNKPLPEIRENTSQLSLAKRHVLVAAMILACGPMFMAFFNAEKSTLLKQMHVETKTQTELETLAGCKPIYTNYDRKPYSNTDIDGVNVGLHSFTYYTEPNNKELITWNNKPYDPEYWSVAESIVSTYKSDFGVVHYKYLQLKNGSGRTVSLVYTWRVNGHYTANPIKAKAQQLVGKLSFDDFGGAALYAASLQTVSPEILIQTLIKSEQESE